jgi:low affinity Fe/Cu permease
MTRSNEPEKKPGKQRTKSFPEMKKIAARANGLPWTSLVGQVTGHPAAFVVVLLYAALWLVFDRQHFDFNAVATLAVWIMTLLIQRANRRDTLALHAKLDELLRVDNDARSELTRLDEKEPEEIEIHRDAEVKKARPHRR